MIPSFTNLKHCKDKQVMQIKKQKATKNKTAFEGREIAVYATFCFSPAYLYKAYCDSEKFKQV